MSPRTHQRHIHTARARARGRFSYGSFGPPSPSLPLAWPGTEMTPPPSKVEIEVPDLQRRNSNRNLIIAARQRWRLKCPTYNGETPTGI